MRAVKKRPLSVEGLYFDFTKRLTPGELLVSCDAQPTMILPSPSNTDVTFGNLGVNTGAPLVPPPPQAPIQQGMGVSCSCSGGLLPPDPSQLSAILPDGTIGTLYQFSFSVTTSAIIDGLNRVIDEQYQLWISNDDFPAYWTSHWELNRRYGAVAINQWADVDNNQVSTDMLSNIWSAVAESTDDMRTQLRGSPLGVISDTIASQSFVLRLNATRMAAAILYRARGVKDTSDDEGRDRFSSDMKRVDKFIKQCRAGQRRLIDGDVGVTSHPFVVPINNPSVPFGPMLSSQQQMQHNAWSELQGIPAYGIWFNEFDALSWGTWW